jgi:hypothetical protein
MRQDFCFRSAGVGDGGDDIPSLKENTGFYVIQWSRVCINRDQQADVRLGLFVFNHHGLTQIVGKNGSDLAVVHHRNASVVIEAMHPPGTIPVQAKVDTLMREITPTPVTPPLVG